MVVFAESEVVDDLDAADVNDEHDVADGFDVMVVFVESEVVDDVSAADVNDALDVADVFDVIDESVGGIC